MGETPGATGLSAGDAREQIAGGEEKRTGVVDIRSVEDFGEAHIPGATHIEEADADAVRTAISEQDDVERWVVVCGDGERSGELASELADGDLDVTYLEGGMEAWDSDDLPRQPPPPEEFEGPKNTTLY